VRVINDFNPLSIAVVFVIEFFTICADVSGSLGFIEFVQTEESRRIN
jgi:hypothetical protein